jgi:hypothetical protein
MATPDTLGGTSLAAWFKADAIALGDYGVSDASAKTAYGGDPAGNAVDGNPGTPWATTSGDMPTWWQIHLRTAKVVTGYAIHRCDDIPARTPTAWTFLGSNDGTSWTTLDTRSGITWPTVGQTQSFTFTNTTAYSYYRINITANGSDSFTQIAEISFTGAVSGAGDGVALVPWLDSSANANNLATVMGTAPIYRATGGPLGLPCVDHTVAAGGLDCLSAAGMPAGDYTYFMVVQSGSTAVQSVMNGGVDSVGGHPQIRLNNLKIELDKSGISAIKTSTAALPVNTWTIVIATFTSVGSVVHFDIGGTTEDYSVGGTTTFTTGNLGYGSYGTGSTLFNGKMAEIGLYSSVLSSGDLTSLKAYLTAKWVTGVATVAGDVALTATSTLTTVAIDTVLPTVALVAASSLTSAVSGVLSATASLTATSSLAATATITEPAAVALVASSTLTPTMAPATMVSLSAVSSLITNAATPVTAAVALSAASTLTTAGTVIVSGVVTLGAVTVAAGPATALAMVQPGTLANPYAASDSDTRSLDFASALFVATEPVAITGPPAAPSVWYEFTESQVADWLASTSSFTNGATIELYSGPPGAGPDDLTFIATDGSSLVTLGVVTVSALATIVATSLRAELVDLGAVAVVATPAVAAVLS